MQHRKIQNQKQHVPTIVNIRVIKLSVMIGIIANTLIQMEKISNIFVAIVLTLQIVMYQIPFSTPVETRAYVTEHADIFVMMRSMKMKLNSLAAPSVEPYVTCPYECTHIGWEYECTHSKCPGRVAAFSLWECCDCRNLSDCHTEKVFEFCQDHGCP